MTPDTSTRFKVRCPHCQQMFIVQAPTTAPSPAAEAPEKPAAPPVAEPRPEIKPPAPAPVVEDEPPLSPEEEDFRERIINLILLREFQLPMLPHVALKVIRLTSDAKSGMQDLAKVILTDQTIASRIIQISNSPVYAGTQEIANITQALVRLGQTEIKNLMLAISLQTKIFKSKLYNRLALRYWERAVGTAFASRVIATAQRTDKEEAFLCGLMHNVGKMIALTIVEQVQKEMPPTFHPSQQMIISILNQYHTDVGELTAIKWTLPKSVGLTIRYYHRLYDMQGQINTVPVVALGEVFCQQAGIGVDQPATLNPAESDAAKILHLNDTVCEDYYQRFIKFYEHAKGEFL